MENPYEQDNLYSFKDLAVKNWNTQNFKLKIDKQSESLTKKVNISKHFILYNNQHCVLLVIRKAQTEPEQKEPLALVQKRIAELQFWIETNLARAR